MKLIVGLGNPGPKYDKTRHNVGFDVVDALAKTAGMALTTEKFHAWFAKGEINGTSVALMKPTTFMNRSGQAVAAAGRFYKLDLADIVAISDDLALPVGRLRMRAKGSAGSHNGLQDIADHAGSTDFCRLRIGIGQPVGVPSVFVLSRFDAVEAEIIKLAIDRAAEAIVHWVEHGPDLTMTRFNGDPPGVKRPEANDESPD
ncbi:MAG: aminoacyl-tRNA hydrolase [Planctomycetota bacterium]